MIKFTVWAIGESSATSSSLTSSSVSSTSSSGEITFVSSLDILPRYWSSAAEILLLVATWTLRLVPSCFCKKFMAWMSSGSSMASSLLPSSSTPNSTTLDWRAILSGISFRISRLISLVLSSINGTSASAAYSLVSSFSFRMAFLITKSCSGFFSVFSCSLREVNCSSVALPEAFSSFSTKASDILIVLMINYTLKTRINFTFHISHFSSICHLLCSKFACRNCSENEKCEM